MVFVEKNYATGLWHFPMKGKRCDTMGKKEGRKTWKNHWMYCRIYIRKQT